MAYGWLRFRGPQNEPPGPAGGAGNGVDALGAAPSPPHRAQVVGTGEGEDDTTVRPRSGCEESGAGCAAAWRRRRHCGERS